MKVALYARISTTNHGQDVNLQLRELREYCQRRNLEITREYADTASGAKDSRPELNRLMVDAKHRRFDAVCVWKLDRFGRSVRHLVNALADLESLRVSFISLKDNLDLSTPSGRLMFQIIGAMAEFERSLIQERVRAGLLWFAKTLCDSFSGPHVTLLHPITRQNPASLAPFRCR